MAAAFQFLCTMRPSVHAHSKTLRTCNITAMLRKVQQMHIWANLLTTTPLRPSTD